MVKSEMKYHPAWSLIMKEKGARKRQVQVFKRFIIRLFCFFVALSLEIVKVTKQTLAVVRIVRKQDR